MRGGGKEPCSEECVICDCYYKQSCGKLVRAKLCYDASILFAGRSREATQLLSSVCQLGCTSF